jgi:hypothetical protein
MRPCLQLQHLVASISEVDADIAFFVDPPIHL